MQATASTPEPGHDGPAAAGLNALRRRLYRALAAEGLGREAIVYARAAGDA